LDSALPPVIPVSALNRAVRIAIEHGVASCWVAGEISNLTRAPSGHWYFSLKDSTASVRCAMFRGRNQFVDFTPSNGQQVEVRAQPTLYEARGEFQLSVDALRRAGVGNLYEAFLRLKAKLEHEGLFAAARKPALPKYPQRIGIITSPRAAALRDVTITLQRRWPAARVILYPSLVQGEGAAAQLLAALQAAIRRAECEVLLLVRGGGSIEDLWAFNDEALARAVAASRIPIVTGVGHETDITLVDFVAALRAPTPTGAAELATPDGPQWRQRLATLAVQLRDRQRRGFEQRAQRLDQLNRRLVHPAQRIAQQRQHLAHLQQRLHSAVRQQRQVWRQGLTRLAQSLRLERPELATRQHALTLWHSRLCENLRRQQQQRTAQIDSLAARLEALNPEAVLQRGYSIVRNAHGQVITQAEKLQVNDPLEIRFAVGSATTTVTALQTP